MQLTPSTAVLDVPGTGSFTLEYSDDDELVSWTWELKDARGNPVLPFYEFGKGPANFVGFKWNGSIFGNVRQLICPDYPTHGMITILATAILKDKKGVKRQEVAKPVVVTFAAVWGGLARAAYPYPVDWEKPWAADPQGQRALVLMWDLINQMPEELRSAAGSIPITRLAKFPFDLAGGFHAPYVSGTITITDGYISLVDPGSPTLTAGDVKFISVVLHEIAHAVTYQCSSVNVHGVMSKIHRALSHPPTPVPNNLWVVSGVLAGLLSIVHLLLIGDFVSGYAHVAGWELTAWYLRAFREIDVVHDVVDLGYWLSHLNENPSLPAINPNVISGYWGIGNFFGLHNRSIDYDHLKQLQDDEARLWREFQKAESDLKYAISAALPPPDLAAATSRRDTARQAWQDKRKELEEGLVSSGAVSRYAALDVLEDIAETITAMTFGPALLNVIRDDSRLDPAITSAPYITATAAGIGEGFARRFRYLQKDAGLFPKNWSPITPGAFMRGDETFDQLDKWRVTF
jgi:hypothetical protein